MSFGAATFTHVVKAAEPVFSTILNGLINKSWAPMQVGGLLPSLPPSLPPPPSPNPGHAQTEETAHPYAPFLTPPARVSPRSTSR